MFEDFVPEAVNIRSPCLAMYMIRSARFSRIGGPLDVKYARRLE
jgi:hypothetical protein